MATNQDNVFDLDAMEQGAASSTEYAAEYASPRNVYDLDAAAGVDEVDPNVSDAIVDYDNDATDDMSSVDSAPVDSAPVDSEFAGEESAEGEPVEGDYVLYDGEIREMPEDALSLDEHAKAESLGYAAGYTPESKEEQELFIRSVDLLELAKQLESELIADAQRRVAATMESAKAAQLVVDNATKIANEVIDDADNEAEEVRRAAREQGEAEAKRIVEGAEARVAELRNEIDQLEAQKERVREQLRALLSSAQSALG